MSFEALVPQDRQERTETHAGFQLHMVSYRLGNRFYATADKVSPGANIARGEGSTREEAESQALIKARERLAQTRTFPTQ